MDTKPDRHGPREEPAPAPPPLPRAEAWVRLGCQTVGVALILFGAYYLIGLVALTFRVLNNPAELKPSLESVGELINAPQIVVRAGGDPVPIGKAISLGALVLWYLLCAWVVGILIGVGTRLVYGAVNERREFYAAMRAFIGAVQDHGQTGKGPS